MRKFGKWKFVLIPFGIAAFVCIIGMVVMTLWNNLLPDILHVTTITFWQAIGIFLLCKILFGFGGKGRHGGTPWMKRRMAERFKNMSPEERETFKSEWEERCGWKGRGFGRHSFSGEKSESTERFGPAAPALSAEENINPS